MASRWTCPHCEFVVWAVSSTVAAAEAAAHLSAHYRRVLSETVFKTTWTCPACDTSGAKLDNDEAMAAFRDHLSDHVADQVENATVGEDVCGPGAVLFLTPDDRRGLGLTRRWMASSADTIITATRTPSAWFRHMEARTADRPDRIVVITPGDAPAGTDHLTEIETVGLGSSPNVGDLGKAVATAVDEHAATADRLAVEFDLLPLVIDACDGAATLRFLHLLEGVFEKADAHAVIPLNPSTVPDPTIGVICDLFDDVRYGEGDWMKRFVMPERAADPEDEDVESTYSQLAPSNQRVVPTGPDRFRYR